MINETLEHLSLWVYFIGITKTQTKWIMLVVVQNCTASWQHMWFRQWNGKIRSGLMEGVQSAAEGRGHTGCYTAPWLKHPEQPERFRTRTIYVGAGGVLSVLSVCCGRIGPEFGFPAPISNLGKVFVTWGVVAGEMGMMFKELQGQWYTLFKKKWGWEQ